MEFKYFEEDKIDLDYICVICHCPLFLPVSNIKCGHTFCKSCIPSLTQCPICRINIISVDFVDAPIIIKKLVNSLKVYCPRCNNTIVERSGLDFHLKTCAILCPFGCGMHFSPALQKTHEENECQNMITKCPAYNLFCDWKGQRRYFQEHIQKCQFIAQSSIITILKNILEEQQREMKEMKNQINAQHTEIKQQKQEIDILKSQVAGLLPSGKGAYNSPALVDNAHEPPLFQYSGASSAFTFNQLFNFNQNAAYSQKYSYEDLKKRPLPGTVDGGILENYLVDADFPKAFNMDKAAFMDLPAWKRKHYKKKAGLL